MILSLYLSLYWSTRRLLAFQLDSLWVTLNICCVCVRRWGFIDGKICHALMLWVFSRWNKQYNEWITTELNHCGVFTGIGTRNRERMVVTPWDGRFFRLQVHHSSEFSFRVWMLTQWIKNHGSCSFSLLSLVVTTYSRSVYHSWILHFVKPCHKYIAHLDIMLRNVVTVSTKSYPSSESARTGLQVISSHKSG